MADFFFNAFVPFCDAILFVGVGCRLRFCFSARTRTSSSSSSDSSSAEDASRSMLSLPPLLISVSISSSSCASVSDRTMSESAVVLVAEMMLSFEGVVGCRAGAAASLVSTAGCLCWICDDGAEFSAKEIFRFFSGVEDEERFVSANFEI